jgi:AraC-like DNA-binding protein
MIHANLSEMAGRSSDGPGRSAPDALSDVLQDLRLSGAAYCRAELSAPWGLEFAPERGAVFHFVAEGSAWLERPSSDPLRLEPGDLVLLPRGVGHALVDRPSRPTKRLHEVERVRVGANTYRLREGGAGERALLVCCEVRFEEPTLHPLLDLMPEVLLVRRGVDEDPSLAPLLEAMAAEVAAQRVGAATVMTRLADIVITRLVRGWVEARADDGASRLAALRDPQIGRAIAALHRRPAEAWSVDSLAAVAGLSRSRFSERFAQVVGVPPARYLARWRMHLAHVWLRQGRWTVSQVAARLGYDSEASFSRAFKRFVGVPPGTLRRSDASRQGALAAVRD